MNTVWLQSLSSALLLTGVIFVGLGGAGTFYFSHKATKEAASQNEAKQKEWSGWITALEHSNKQLRDLPTLRDLPNASAIANETPAPAPQPDTAKLAQEQPAASAAPAKTEAPAARIAAKTSGTETGLKIPATTMKTPVPPIIGFMETKAGLPPVGEQLSSPLPTSDEPARGRTLDEKQFSDIVKTLHKHAAKSSITIRAASEDPESFEFATILRRAFAEAGWKVDGIKQVNLDKPVVGINLSAGTFPAPDGVVATYMALTSAGFKVSQQLDSKLAGQHAELTVGSAQ
jgi:hypothetical protein